MGDEPVSRVLVESKIAFIYEIYIKKTSLSKYIKRAFQHKYPPPPILSWIQIAKSHKWSMCVCARSSLGQKQKISETETTSLR